MVELDTGLDNKRDNVLPGGIQPMGSPSIAMNSHGIQRCLPASDLYRFELFGSTTRHGHFRAYDVDRFYPFGPALRCRLGNGAQARGSLRDYIVREPSRITGAAHARVEVDFRKPRCHVRVDERFRSLHSSSDGSARHVFGPRWSPP